MDRNCLRTILALLLCSFNLLFADSIDRELESAYVDQFSREFGYTLIGEKPASIEELNNEYLAYHPYVIHRFLDSLRKTFDRSEKLIFKVFNESERYFTAELIHLPAIRTLIFRNSRLRNFVEKNFQKEADFYEGLKNQNLKLFDLLKRDPYIIGIVLGYGNTNSEYFCLRGQIGRYLKKYYFGGPFSFYRGACLPWIAGSWPQNLKVPYSINKPKVDLSFGSLEEEWQWIQKIWWDLDEERTAKPPYFIALPFYVCRHGGDSEIVREKYKRARAKLANLFCNKSYQDAVISEVAKK